MVPVRSVDSSHCAAVEGPQPLHTRTLAFVDACRPLRDSDATYLVPLTPQSGFPWRHHRRVQPGRALLRLCLRLGLSFVPVGHVSVKLKNIESEVVSVYWESVFL